MAGRRCTVCGHADRPAVDQAIINHRPFRRIAAQFSLSLNAVIRHHEQHIPEVLAKAKAAEEAARADDLLDQLKIIRTKALQLMVAAERAGDLRTALVGVRETRACLELLLELEQRIDRRPILNILLQPEWPMIRAIVLDAVRDDPARRQHVLDRLRSLEPV